MDLYVGNLPYDLGEDELREQFSPFGTVNKVTIINDRDTGRPKGYAFVSYEEDSAAERALEEMNGKEVGGRPLKVNSATPREERPQRQFGGGGRGDYGSQNRRPGGGYGGHGGGHHGGQRPQRGGYDRNYRNSDRGGDRGGYRSYDDNRNSSGSSEGGIQVPNQSGRNFRTEHSDGGNFGGQNHADGFKKKYQNRGRAEGFRQRKRSPFKERPSEGNFDSSDNGKTDYEDE